MSVQRFINIKAQQLTFYVRAFWDQKIPYSEINLYFWDTLEEWTQVRPEDDEPYSQKERVFWHLMHQLHFWPEKTLLHDEFLRDELAACVSYLEGAGICPLDCIGIRP